MKYPALVLGIALCLTIFVTGCEPLPKGDCWPAELSGRVPLGVTFALKRGISPYGIITQLVEEIDDFDCDDTQSITFGPAYRKAYFNREARSSSPEDILIFHNTYVFAMYCDGQSIGRVEVDKWCNRCIWIVDTIGVSGKPLEELEDYLGPDFTDCTRGLIETHYPYVLCAIVTDKQGITRFYPLNPASPVWGDTQDMQIGELSLTKEEFFEWYDNLDLEPL